MKLARELLKTKNCLLAEKYSNTEYLLNRVFPIDGFALMRLEMGCVGLAHSNPKAILGHPYWGVDPEDPNKLYHKFGLSLYILFSSIPLLSNSN